MYVIDVSDLNIKPAFKKNDDDSTASFTFKTTEAPVFEKDKNSILSALLRKGAKPEVVIKPEIVLKKQQKPIGAAESKLKSLMGKTNDKGNKKQQPTNEKPIAKRTQQKKQNNSQIGEEINEQFDEYGNESFQKLSGAYESVIKQSIVGDSNIRQSIAGQSNIIKESIRESIRESIASSSGKIKESIRQDIKESIQGSSKSLKEEIIQEISASHRKSKESIEQVYEQVFEEESLSNSLLKSQNKFKKNAKNNDSDSLSQSQSASKSFRMKTNIVKSLKFAQQLSRKDKLNIKTDVIEDKAMSEIINKEKQNIKKIQDNMSKLLSKNSATTFSQKNKDLYYNFKIQINKLLTGDHFESKLKKLVSFLSVGDDIVPNKQYMNDLEDNILKNIMSRIEDIKVGQSHLTEAQKIKKEYEDKLTQQLRIQEVNLRAQMNQKLSEKDLQLKKMIAQLESRMMSRTIHVQAHGRGDYTGFGKSQQYQVESDYSIDSDNISWKADLWELLPEYEKKKLYQKQTAQVTKFLTDVMINQLKQQALDRSLEISFQFPEQYNNLSGSYEQPIYEKKTQKQKINQKSFTKKQTQSRHQRSDFLSDLPKISTKKIVNQDESKSFNAPKQEIETKFEATRKDEKLKPQIIKILSEYKSIYLKKKIQTIKNILKILTSKDAKVQNAMYSSLQQLAILTQKQMKKQHHMYIRAYEQEIIMSLVGIYTRTLNKKLNKIEDQMKNMYDRLLVVSQVATAEKCIQRVSLDVQKDSTFNVEILTNEALRKMEIAPCPIEILANENYMQLKMQRQQKQVKHQLVEHIVSILSSQFAKQFPKKKK